MRALLQTRYGSPQALRFIEVDKPIPKADQVLIKVRAVGLNAADWRLLTGSPFFIRLIGLGKGKIAGSDMAGRSPPCPSPPHGHPLALRRGRGECPWD